MIEVQERGKPEQKYIQILKNCNPIVFFSGNKTALELFLQETNELREKSDE
jgi:hypothetical protein